MPSIPSTCNCTHLSGSFSSPNGYTPSLARKRTPAATFHYHLLFSSALQLQWAKAISLSSSQLDQVDVALQLNSFMISFHIHFLNPPLSVSDPCQHSVPYTTLSSSTSSSSVHSKPSSTSRSSAMWDVLAPARRQDFCDIFDECLMHKGKQIKIQVLFAVKRINGHDKKQT